MSRSRPLASAVLAGLLVVAALPTLSSNAFAQATTAGNRQEAHARFKRATAAYEEGRYEEARILLTELWKERQTYDVASLFGLVEYKLKHYAAAARYLSIAIPQVPPFEKPEVAERMERALAEVKKIVAILQVTTNQDGVEVFVDGEPVGKAPFSSEVYLDVGPHTVEGRHGEQTLSKKIDALTAQKVGVDFQFSEADMKPASATSPSTTEPPELDRGSGGGSWVPVIAGGVLTAAGLGVGLGFHFAAQGNKDDRQQIIDDIGSNTCGQASSPAECATVSELAETHQRNRNLSTTGFVVGGAAAIGTFAYFVITRPDKKPASATASIRVDGTATADGGSLFLSGTF